LRIDRIYISTSKAKYTFTWEIWPSLVLMDHWLASIRYTPKGAPHIGEGRWTLPLNILNNKTLQDSTIKEGITLRRKMETLTRTQGAATTITTPKPCPKHYGKSLSKIS